MYPLVYITKHNKDILVYFTYIVAIQWIIHTKNA